MMRHRHLDYPPGTPVEELGRAALDDLLDRGDLGDWAPLARAVARDPHGALADRVLGLCEAHSMYGTSVLWRAWIGRLRGGTEGVPAVPEDAHPTRRLAELRAERGLTQAEVADRLGTGQSDVSKLERRADVRLSTLAAYIAATGGRLRLVADYSDASFDLTPGGPPPRR